MNAVQYEYKKREYIPRNEAESLASTLSLGTRTGMTWFANHRLYKLISHSPKNKKGDELIEGNADPKSCSNQESVQDKKPADTHVAIEVFLPAK